MKPRGAGLLSVAVSAVLIAAGSNGCTRSAPSQNGAERQPTIGFVTNGIASFWLIAEKGAQTAAAESNVKLEVRMPPKGVADQKRMVEELLVRRVDGIAISPIDPANQGDLLDEIAAATRLITHDSDAPQSKRLCYIGMDNYTAGRACGKLVKQALPDGGSVMLFVGRLGQDNAKLRRQGLIDELLGRSLDPSRYDEPGQEVRGDKYVVLDTRTDQFDFAKAKALAQDAITKYPELGCMVGLFAYNPPKILEAVREAGREGQIKIVGFDEDEETLQAISDGAIYATVVQSPYRYGYESVKLLAALARGDDSVLPPGKFIDIPVRSITRENIADFRAELAQLLGQPGKP